DHLAALVALYRPGPMAHIPSYIARRDRREAATPPDPALADVLEESYGIIVYQDQVLRVVGKLAGYSLGQADVLRRAMGKKEKEVMAQEGPRFIEAVIENGYPKQTAERVWDLLQPFAGYAFNKAHAYCYALVAYQTAYFKANYPAEWFAAVLSTIAGDTDKIVGVVGECRRLDVPILPPDVNASGLEFRVESPGIRFGLAAVKNVGEGAVEQMLHEREANGPYLNLEEFCRRQDLHTINKRVIESLIKCGAMDSFGQREALLDSKRLDSAIAAAQIDQKAASTGQVSLFDMFAGADVVAANDTVPPLATNGAVAPAPSPSREWALWEKEVLGFQFGDHPYMEAAAWLANQLTHDTSQLTLELSGERVKIAGLVTGVRRIMTKTKSQMAVLQLEDLHGTIEAVVFPRIYERSAELFRDDAILIIEGKVDARSDRDRPQVVVDRADEWTAPTKGTPPPPRLETNAMSRNGGAHAPDAARLPNGESSLTDQSQSPTPNGAQSQIPRPNGAHSPTRPAESAALSSSARGAERRVLWVVVPRGEDDNACVRLLEQLHILVERFPGSDEIRLVLHD
ncbi:MAG: hypothetical protein LC797_12145, partial [Chloroflexi bacterium]|nr:hypothetical protein [Chloroflexota bacterium]